MKFVIKYRESNGKKVKERKRPLTLEDDKAAKEAYREFCRSAESDGIGPSIHPTGLFRKEGKKEVEIKVD